MVDAVPPPPKLTLSEQPKSDVTGAVFNRPLPVSIAGGLEQLGSGAEDLADTFARQQGQADATALATGQGVQSSTSPPAGPNGSPTAAPDGSSPSTAKAVTLGPDGQPQVAHPLNSVILGRAGEEYQQAFLQGGRAALQSSLATDVADLRVQYPDAQSFKAAYTARANAERALHPGPLGDALANEVNDLGAQHYTNIVENDIKLHTAVSLQAIQTNIADATNRMQALARAGAIDTPQYDKLSDQLQDNYDALGGNKLFGYSPEKIASDQAHAFDELNGEYVVGRVDDIYNRKGKAAALDVIKNQIDNNPDLQLSDAERNQLHNYAISRLSYLSQEQASNLAALKPTIDLQMKALRSGNSGPDAVSEQEIGQTLAQLRGLGAFKEAQQLQSTQIVADRTNAFKNLSPDGKAQALLDAANAGVGGPVASGVNSEQGALQFFQSKGWTPAQAAGIVGNLIHESGGGRLNPNASNPGDGSDGSTSIGIGQWNSDRANALRAFAAAQGKPVNDLGTQLGFVQHELETSEGAAAQRLRAAQTPQDAAAAFALGYERPAGFQTGDLSKVAGGQNRLDQTLRLAGGGASGTAIPAGGASPGVTTFGQPFTEAEAQANPWLRTAYRQQIQVDDATQILLAKNQFEALQNSIKYTGSVGPDIVGPAALALQIADRFPDKLGKEAAELRGTIAGGPAGFAAAGSPDQGGSLLSATEQLARNGDPLGNAVYKSAQEGIKQGRELLENDQYQYATQAGWIPRKPIPLNFADPAQLRQGIVERGQAATKIAANQYLSGVGVFSKNELPQVKDIAANGSVDQKTALMSSIVGANMPQGVLKATLAQLGADPTTSPLAVAGDVARFDPGAGRDIIQGQALMAAEPKLVPGKGVVQSEFAKALPFNDMPDGPLRQAYGTATEALYAKMSAAAGDTTGVLNDDRLAAAVKGTTGGVVEWRGAKAFAPWYGATQDQFDGAIRSVTDADLANSRGSDGIPLRAKDLLPSLSGAFNSSARWRLESVGEGKYLIYAGPDEHDQRQYLGSTSWAKGAPSQSGKFVLDLGAKRAEVEARAAGSFSHTPFSDMFGSAYLRTGAGDAIVGGPY